jgi:hypothetical protein
MKIEATHMIDRSKRAHMALIAVCLQEQCKPSISADRFMELQHEINHCEKMVQDCQDILTDEAHGN